jgi:transposase
MRYKPYRRYDEEFRAGALAVLDRSQRPLAAVAKSLGVLPGTLRYWYDADVAKRGKKKASQVAKVPLGEPVAESPEEKVVRLEAENKALRSKVTELEMHRDILKKATAFFAKESE